MLGLIDDTVLPTDDVAGGHEQAGQFVGLARKRPFGEPPLPHLPADAEHVLGERRRAAEIDISASDDAYWAAKEPTGLEIGRYSHGGFFGCSADHRHPVTFHSQ
ncbi:MULTISPECIES: hypothetical protein [Actinomadura]|uniref:Uncharacterized protein n=1 Tax=Actinomadura geliboluensis TaxID=882440 RepID=A0A5S4HCH8_9ACTN|nr:hypothetical protein [Actinomadura geliboluensis]TMR42471.1 hypothetical protein ETD96_00215 [Actinomadura geliboluensis]